MRSREQAAEIPVAVPRLDEQRDVRTSVERDLRAGDRPHAERLRRVRELERAVDAVVVGERERLVPELRRPRRELLRLRRAVQERVRRVSSAARRSPPLGCRKMVEIGTGEVIFGSPKLDVMLLADIEQLAAVEVRSAPGWGNSSPHVHARHAEALYVFEGELTLQLEDRAHSIGPETWAFVPHGITHAFEVSGDGRRGSSSSTPRPRASATTSAAMQPPSIFCPRSTPSRAIPVSSSSVERAARKATTSPTARIDEPRSSSSPRSSRSPSSTTGRASAVRRGTSIASMRTHSSSSTASSRSTCTTARGHFPGARSSSSHRASCTASTTTRAGTRARSTSTCRCSASPTTCAGGTPPSTSSTRPRTAAPGPSSRSS